MHEGSPVAFEAVESVGDVATVIEVLADSFDGYPLTEWVVLRDARHPRRLERYVHEMVELAAARGHALLDPEGRGAALWFPSERAAPGWPQLARRLPRIASITGLRRMASRVRGLAALADDHPSERHAYLSMLGVRRDHQRKGIGTALLEAGLARCDAAGVAAYLHTSNPEAMPFYARHGFDTLGEPLRLPDGPPVWRLWRPRRPDGALR